MRKVSAPKGSVSKVTAAAKPGKLPAGRMSTVNTGDAPKEVMKAGQGRGMKINPKTVC